MYHFTFHSVILIIMKEVFFINTKYKTIENRYEIKDNIALISIFNKKGKELIAKIDVEDIEKVKGMGSWFAEWHKDFNSYLVQNLSSTTPIKKSTIQSVILKVNNNNAPINHINGDTLDNRKCNLEIVQRNKKNNYEIIGENTVSINLVDRNGKVSSKALISKEDLDVVLNGDLSWVEYKANNKINVVANTPNGRVYLDKFLMNPIDTEKVHHINLNPLDCRRTNLENKKIEF